MEIGIYISGSVEKNIIEITNCFAVPHNESDDEVIKLKYHWFIIDVSLPTNSSNSLNFIYFKIGISFTISIKLFIYFKLKKKFVYINGDK